MTLTRLRRAILLARFYLVVSCILRVCMVSARLSIMGTRLVGVKFIRYQTKLKTK